MELSSKSIVLYKSDPVRQPQVIIRSPWSPDLNMRLKFNIMTDSSVQYNLNLSLTAKNSDPYINSFCDSKL